MGEGEWRNECRRRGWVVIYDDYGARAEDRNGNVRAGFSEEGGFIYDDEGESE